MRSDPEYMSATCACSYVVATWKRLRDQEERSSAMNGPPGRLPTPYSRAARSALRITFRRGSDITRQEVGRCPRSADLPGTGATSA